MRRTGLRRRRRRLGRSASLQRLIATHVARTGGVRPWLAGSIRRAICGAALRGIRSSARAGLLCGAILLHLCGWPAHVLRG